MSAAYRACLFPLLEALGWQGDRDSLSEYLSNDASPADLDEFRNTMAALRFDSVSHQERLSELSAGDLPCLYIDVEGRPFCLLAQEGESLLCFDGNAGIYRLLEAEGSGTIVSLNPLEDGADSILASRPDWLWLLLGRFKALFAASLGLSVILGSLSILYPILIALIFSQMGIQGNTGSLWMLGIGALLFLVADSGFRSLRSGLLGYASQRSGKILGDELFRRLVSFQLSFTEQASTEAQVRRIKDLRTVAAFIGGSALAAIFDLPFVVIMIIWLVSVGGSVALVPALGLLAFIITSLVAYPVMKRMQADASLRKSERMDQAASIVTCIEDIATSGMKSAWADKFAKASGKAASALYTESAGSAAIGSISGFFVSAGGLATLYVGVSAVLSGRMAASALVAAMMLVWRVLGVARSTFVILGQIDSLGASLRQLQRFMALPQEITTTPFTLPTRPPEGDLEFQDVSFRYGTEGYPALYTLSFKAKSGKVTVLAGRQGAGKTTVIKLTLGLYKPQVGRVMIGPFNIRQSDPSQLRRTIAYAPETPMMLRGSILNYIRGSSGQSIQKVSQLAQELGLLEALKEVGLPLEAEIPADFEDSWPDAARLTSICRACVKASTLYLFDEQEFRHPERYQVRFEQMLRKLANSGAVVLMLQTAPHAPWADEILELDGGKLVQARKGSKDE